MTVETRLDFAQLSSDEIQQTLNQYQISLSIDEAQTIQKLLERPPTLTECLLWSIQGSEHCSYKSSRNHLMTLPTSGPNLILGPKEDAGIVHVATNDKGVRYGIAMSHESHNHPSQVVPFEGAATGVGGNVRDVCCMGAEVIALADSLRFGDIKEHKSKWIHEGVVAGIASYGNALGIANLSGDAYYDAGYNDNCLVTVVTLGCLREDQIVHSYAPKDAVGYDLILIGKPTDRSGFGGASFASLHLEEDKREQNSGAVQEPNAFLERHILKSTYALIEKIKQDNLFDKVGFKDLGAGGVACAGVEIAEAAGYGAEIDLEKVHVSIEDLPPSVILCAETQERFMWAAHPDLTPMILKHYNEEFALPEVSAGAQASVVGKIIEEDLFVVRYKGEDVVRAKATDITKGIVYDRPLQEFSREVNEPNLDNVDCKQTLLQLLQHENIAARTPIWECYDKQVQGRTVIERDQAPAGVMQPFNSDKFPTEIQKTGISLSVTQHPGYGKIDAYWTGVNAVVQSACAAAATGCSPTAISDCLCFGSPEIPEQMYEFAQSVKGIGDACKAIHIKEYKDAHLTVCAGNVSFYNESPSGAIPSSPMIACLGRMDNVEKAIDRGFKHTDSDIVMLGERRDECGGSVFYQMHDEVGANVPQPDLKEINNQIQAVLEGIEQDCITAVNIISEGGIACALATMCFSNDIACRVEVPGDLPLAKRLFSQTPGFVLEVKDSNAFETICEKHQVSMHTIGKTQKGDEFELDASVSLSLKKSKQAWLNGLREKLQ